jgi:hypothetical protein
MPRPKEALTPAEDVDRKDRIQDVAERVLAAGGSVDDVHAALLRMEQEEAERDGR